MSVFIFEGRSAGRYAQCPLYAHPEPLHVYVLYIIVVDDFYLVGSWGKTLVKTAINDGTIIIH